MVPVVKPINICYGTVIKNTYLPQDMVSSAIPQNNSQPIASNNTYASQSMESLIILYAINQLADPQL